MVSTESCGPVVLIVDDEALLRLNAVDFLNDAGYSTFEAGNCVDALAMIEGNPEITVLFTDIDVPGDFDGLELVARVGERWPEIQLIVASGKTVPTEGQLPSRGHFVSKPYTAGRITQLVASRR